SDQLNQRVRKVDISTGIITTIAGNGTAAYAGDGGPATSANLSRPYGLAFDAAGNLYIADRSNNVIRKVTLSTGIISTVAGNNTVGFSGDGASALSANLNRPLAIAFYGGNLYFADNGNNRIRMVDGSGIINTVAGNGAGTFAGDGGAATSASIFEPSGIVFDGSGVRMVSSTGTITTAAGYDSTGFNGDCLTPTATRLSQPSTVVFDNMGNLTICDKDNNRIRKVLQPCTGTPTAGLAIATVTDGCPYYGTTLSVSGGQLGCDLNYQWQTSATVSGGFTNISGATNNTFFLAPGASAYYRMVVTCVNTGLSDTSSTVYLHVNALPVISNIAGPTQVCIGDTITLTDTATTGAWYATNTNATVSTSGRVIGVTPGIDTIIYYSSNFCGTVYDSQIVTINPIVTPYVTINTFPGTAVCHGTSVTYTANTLNAGATPGILWYVNGLYSGSGASLTYTPLNGDVISVILSTSAPCATTPTATASDMS
ncbi:MAG: hypothetical protein EBZ77_14990, partial [Chitinophagia bacterium]|nr:hypothetical protein [Chitinophagia bacterium]